ncbi:MAG TPA: oligosaccharide flippase family protein [Myxococcales bacterium]
MRERILRNLKAKTLGEFGSRAVSIAFGFVLARALGRELFGRYSYACSFSLIIALCGEFGLNTLLTVHASREREKAAEWLRRFAPLRLATVLLAVAATVVLALLTTDRSRWLEIALMATFFGLNTFLDYHSSIFTGFERMNDDAYVRIATRLIVAGLGSLSLLLQAPLWAVLATMTAANALSAGMAWLWRRRTGLTFGFGWDGAFAARAFRGAIPTAATLICLALYFYLDNLVLGLLHFSDSDIGQYGAANKVFDASQGLPSIAIGALFPILAELSKSGDLTKIAPFFTKVSRWCLVIGAPVAGVAYVFSPFVAELLFGREYVLTRPALAILALAAPLFFSNNIAVFLLLAISRPWTAVLFRLGASVVKALAIVVLARRFGATSAAVAMLATDALLFLVLIAWRKRAGLSEPGERTLVLKVAIASAAAIGFWIQTQRLHFVAQAVAVAVAYFAAYAVLGLLPGRAAAAAAPAPAPPPPGAAP